MTSQRIETDLEKILTYAGLLPEIATPEEVAMADRMLMIYGTDQLIKAGNHLHSWLDGRRG